MEAYLLCSAVFIGIGLLMCFLLTRPNKMERRNIELRKQIEHEKLKAQLKDWKSI